MPFPCGFCDGFLLPRGFLRRWVLARLSSRLGSVVMTYVLVEGLASVAAMLRYALLKYNVVASSILRRAYVIVTTDSAFLLYSAPAWHPSVAYCGLRGFRSFSMPLC